MSAKHTDPEYIANARLVRQQVRRMWKYGEEVRCWRRGEVIEPGSPFDVGHLDPDGGHARGNLAPECIRCNRSEGGRRGAALTNARRGARRPAPAPAPRPDRSRLPPW
ncbi:hypothetical protein [Microbacterium sp. GXF7504]